MTNSPWRNSTLGCASLSTRSRVTTSRSPPRRAKSPKRASLLKHLTRCCRSYFCSHPASSHFTDNDICIFPRPNDFRISWLESFHFHFPLIFFRQRWPHDSKELCYQSAVSVSNACSSFDNGWLSVDSFADDSSCVCICSCFSCVYYRRVPNIFMSITKEYHKVILELIQSS